MHQQNQSWEKWMRWGQQGTPSSHWTTGIGRHWFVCALLALTLFHFWLSVYLPPAEDELYYWAWAQRLDWSYYDHPPMVAYLIRLATGVFGDNLFGIRFFAVVWGSAILLLLGTILPSKQLLGFVLLTPISIIGALVMTPDIPLLFFWTCYVLWVISVNRKFSEWSDDPVSRVYRPSPVGHAGWAWGGVLLGLGLMSKYTMGLAVPCSFLVLASKYRMRSWLKGYAVHLFVAAVVASPILYFNIQHGFQPLKFQWGHAFSEMGFSSATFFDFVGSQLLLVGALPLLVLPWACLRLREIVDDHRMQVCFIFFTVPFLFFLMQATRSKLEANWGLVAYLSLFPLAQRLLDYSSFRYVGKTIVAIAFLIPVITSGLLLFHTLSPLQILPAAKDRIGKLQASFELSRALAKDVPELVGHSTVFLPTYQWTSYLRFQGISAEQLHPEGRASQFTLDPKDVCSQASAVTFMNPQSEAPVLACFPRREIVKEYPLVVRGEETGRYAIIRYSK